VAHALAQAEGIVGDWREAGRALEHYDAVGVDDVKRVAAEYLQPGRRSVVVLEPEGKR
jgi:predicted Zn-dependent peptidase